MAKSIYEILDSLETETSTSDHGMVGHTLPRALFPTGEIFGDSEKLISWAKENGITYACIQKGIQKFLIEARAKFKAVKKGEEWTSEKGQIAVDGMTWDITERPGIGTNKKVDDARYNDCLALIISLTNAKMKKDKIITTASPIYGEKMVTGCFEAIEKMQAENTED